MKQTQSRTSSETRHCSALSHRRQRGFPPTGLAKNSPEKATGALVSILAHITRVELRDRLDSTEIANGFANRFIYIAARRSLYALRYASVQESVGVTPEAWQPWDGHYESLTTSPPGLVGAVTGRAATTVRRVSVNYALIDERDEVDEQHLLAALEMWRYVEESARWVFGNRLGERVADACLAGLREAGADGMTRTELREALGHRMSASRITDALEVLKMSGLAHMVKEPTSGRPVERWFEGSGAA